MMFVLMSKDSPQTCPWTEERRVWTLTMDKTQADLKAEWNLTTKQFSRLQKRLLDDLKAHLDAATLPELGYFNGERAKAYHPWEEALLLLAKDRQPIGAIARLYLDHHPYLQPAAAFLAAGQGSPQVIIEDSNDVMEPFGNTALTFHAVSLANRREQLALQTDEAAGTTFGNVVALRQFMRHSTIEFFETAAVQDLHDGMTAYQQQMNQGLSKVATQVKKSGIQDVSVG